MVTKQQIMQFHIFLVTKGLFINANLLLQYLRGLHSSQILENLNFWANYLKNKGV